MNKPNVLVVCQRPPYPPNKGEKLRTYYQIKFLVEAGYAVYVACPTETAEAEDELQQLNALMLQGAVSERIANGALAKLGALFSGKSISEGYFYINKLQHKINQLVMQKEITTVLVTASSLVNYVAKLPIKKYIDFMDLDSDKWQQYANAANPLMKQIYQRESRLIAKLETQAVQSFEECYLISNNEIDLLTKLMGNSSAPNVKKIANGIASEEFHPPTTPRRTDIADDPKLLFVGVMDYKPNEDAVIWFCNHVWPSVKKAMPNAQFSIVGMSPSNDVKALAKLPGVVVTGKVPSVLPYFHEADMFVAPFRLARGVQNKILQAFACGLPVITSNMGLEGIEGLAKLEAPENSQGVENSEGTTDNSPAITCTTAEDYIKTIVNLCGDASARQTMSNEGTRVISQFYAWESVLQGFMNIKTGATHEG